MMEILEINKRPASFFYHALLMTPRITAMMAMTNNMWIMPPVAYPPRNEIAQIITRTTAIKYNIDLIFLILIICLSADRLRNID
jgi:hypothetical protein